MNYTDVKEESVPDIVCTVTCATPIPTAHCRREPSFRAELRINVIPSPSNSQRVRFIAAAQSPGVSTARTPITSLGKGLRGPCETLSDGEKNSSSSWFTKHNRAHSEGKTLYTKRISASSSDSEISSSPQSASVVDGSMVSLSTNQSHNWLSRRRLSKRKESQRRRVSCQDVGGGDCEGWLWKKTEKVGLGRKKWMTCWVVLHLKRLYCFKSPEDKSAHSTVFLPGFCISPAPEIRRKQFAFKVHHTGTTFYFASDRQDDMAKWMNKMALATLGDLNDMDNISISTLEGSIYSADSSSRSGFDSESDEESSHDTSGQSSPTSSYRSTHSVASSNASREDLTDLYMRLRRADLDIAGTNVREKRHTVFRNETLRATSCTETDQQRWRRILSLQRTLKDKEQCLEAIEALISSNPITSQLIRSFREQYPAVATLDGEQTPQVEEKKIWPLDVRTSQVESDGTSSGTLMHEETEDCA